MRFEQTRTLLRRLVPDYHRAVSHHYQKMAETGVSPRVQLMLDYLIDHELHRALALKEFCEEASAQTLDHWIKGVEIHFPEPHAEILTDTARTDLDHLLSAAVHFKSELIHYFEHLLEHCSDKKTADLFQTLRNQEEKAMKRMIRHAQGLADL